MWPFRHKARAELHADIQTYQDIRKLFQEALDKNLRVSDDVLERIRYRHLALNPLNTEQHKDLLALIILSEQAAYGVFLLKESELLDACLPYLRENQGIEQGGLHHLDVLDHSIEALKQLLRFFPEADLALRLATLLHDVGKASCLELDDYGQRSFYGHAERGAELSVNMLESLDFETEICTKVKNLVHYHMLPSPKNSKAARRFAQRRHELLPDLLQLMIADREAARGKLANEASRKHYRLAVARVLKALEETPEEKPFLTGEEIMRILKLNAGPKVGEVVTFLRDATLAGDIRDKEEAKLAIEHYAKKQAW